MNKILHHRALTPQEVQRIGGIPLKVVKYNELKNYKNMKSLFGKYKAVLLLYLQTNNTGHWVCLINQPHKIIFFDPYALEPDDQLKFTNIKCRKYLGVDFPYLTFLLYHSNKPIDYNNKQFQIFDDKISTCGYHCGFRIRNWNLDSDQYIKLFKGISNNNIDNEIIIFGDNYI